MQCCTVAFALNGQSPGLQSRWDKDLGFRGLGYST